MASGKEIWHGEQTNIASIICEIHDFMLSFCRSKRTHNTLDVSLRIASPYVTVSPWELMGCPLPGQIHTDRFRFRRRLWWTFFKKWNLFRGLLFREQLSESLSGRSPLNQQCMNLVQTQTGGLQVWKNIFDQFVLEEDRRAFRHICICVCVDCQYSQNNRFNC